MLIELNRAEAPRRSHLRGWNQRSAAAARLGAWLVESALRETACA